MRKSLIVGLMLLLVAGCSRVNIDAATLNQGRELCKENGGLTGINRIHDWVYPNFICGNGVVFEIYGDRIERHEPINNCN